MFTEMRYMQLNEHVDYALIRLISDSSIYDF